MTQQRFTCEICGATFPTEGKQKYCTNIHKNEKPEIISVGFYPRQGEPFGITVRFSDGTEHVYYNSNATVSGPGKWISIEENKE